LVIYISEAHAADEWPLSNKYLINQHKTIEDRLEAVKLLQNETEMEFEIYMDSLDSVNFEKVYSCWPERGFVFLKGKIEYIAYPSYDAGIYWKDEIAEWLKNVL
jgi:hypothetical protein